MIQQDLQMGYIDMDKVRESFGDIFVKMNRPMGFTINFHRYQRHKTKNGWHKERISVQAVENFWNFFCGNLSHAQYHSYQRKQSHTSTLCFANMDVGIEEELLHIHGVANNILDIPEAVFKWVINQSIREADRKSHIVSGDPHIETKDIDKGWVGYCFKSNGLCYPLYGR